MLDKQTLSSHLEDFRAGLVADGYDLTVDDLSGGVAKLRISAGPEACAECLVPKKLMISMLEATLDELPEVPRLELTYPNE